MALDLDMLRKPNSRKKGLKILVYGPTGVGKTVFGLSFPEIIAMDSEDGYAWYEGTERAKNLLGGLKILVYGPTGVGKTVFGLSFPEIIAMDSEDGYAWYEGTERAKNLLGIVDSQSFDDLANLIDELDENVDDFKTLIIDSETKIYENIQEALQEVEESRAIRKGKDVLDANLSVRSWGKIKQLSSRLQNLKLKLASQGINIVSIAQASDVMKDAGGGVRVKTGEKPDMAKKAPFDYDVVLRLFTRDNKYFGVVEKDRTDTYARGVRVKTGEKPDMAKKAPFDYDVVLRLFTRDNKYFGVVEKDRTDTYARGAEIENPSYANWAKRLEADDNKGNVIVKDFSKDKKKAKVAYEESITSEMPFEDQVADFLSLLEGQDKKQEFATKVKEMTGSKTLSALTKEQQNKVIKYMNEQKVKILDETPVAA